MSADADRPVTMADLQAALDKQATKTNDEVNRALKELTAWVAEFMKGTVAFEKQVAEVINGGAAAREPAQVLRLEHAVVGPSKRTVGRDGHGNITHIVDEP